MIPRLDLRTTGRVRHDEWPERGRPLEAARLFEPRPAFRKIRIMIDADQLASWTPGSVPTKEGLLTDLCGHGLVSLLRYSDAGPPEDVERVRDEAYLGWAVASRAQSRSGWDVIYSTDRNSFTTSGVGVAMAHLAEKDVHADCYRDLGAEEAARRREADMIAAEVAASAIGADIFVTERPYLYAATWGASRGTKFCRAPEALALLGLYLRSQGAYAVSRSHRFNKGLFYWVGMRELLPESWRWFSACLHHDHTTPDSLTNLAGSLLQRVSRALEARDAIHVAVNQPADNDNQDDALSQLDVTLVNLMGACDAAARVAHRVLRLPANGEYRAAWQSRTWLDQVVGPAPSLENVVAVGSTGDNVLTILRLLRNSVHGEALQGIAVQKSGSPSENLVSLPPNDEARLLTAMDDEGGRSAWGARDAAPEVVFLDAGVFVDRMLIGVVELLNELMRYTPVESLQGASLTPSDLVPPDGDVWRPWMRQSIRWQMGF
jgi:hypothetical protein